MYCRYMVLGDVNGYKEFGHVCMRRYVTRNFFFIFLDVLPVSV